MDVLVHLAKHSGAAVTSADLMETVWGNVVVGDNALHRSIALIRKATGDTAKNPKFIETVPRRGYRFIAPVEWSGESDDIDYLLVGAKTDHAQVEQLLSELRKSDNRCEVAPSLISDEGGWSAADTRSLQQATCVVLFVSEDSVDQAGDLGKHIAEQHKQVFLVLLDDSEPSIEWRRYPEAYGPSLSSAGLANQILQEVQGGESDSEVSTPSTRPSLVVLPFRGQAETADLASGVLTETVHNLSLNREFFVISSGTSLSYSSEALEIGKIGRELNVEYALTGTLQAAGEKIRLTTELCDTASERVLWSERFESQADDLFSLQDDLARAVAVQLQPNITRREIKRVSVTSRDQLSAWEIYQRARRYDWSGKWLRRSIDELKEAVELEPELAPAHALLACRMVYLLWHGDFSFFNQVFEHLKTAQSLAPKDPMVHVASVIVHAHTGSADKALGAANTAIEVNPNLAEAWAYLGFCMGMTGDRGGIDRIEMAFRLSPRDPLRYVWHLFELVCYTGADEYEAAVASANKSIELRDDWFLVHMFRATLLAVLRQKDEAQQSWQTAKALNPMVSYDAVKMWLESSQLNQEQKTTQLDALRECECS